MKTRKVVIGHLYRVKGFPTYSRWHNAVVRVVRDYYGEGECYQFTVPNNNSMIDIGFCTISNIGEHISEFANEEMTDER